MYNQQEHEQVCLYINRKRSIEFNQQAKHEQVQQFEQSIQIQAGVTTRCNCVLQFEHQIKTSSSGLRPSPPADLRSPILK